MQKGHHVWAAEALISPVLGCVVLGCLVLVATLPLTSVVAGVAVFAVGVVGRALVRRVPGSR